MLAGRCHVFDTNRQVIRYVRSRMLKKQRLDTSPNVREVRKQVYRDALEAHKENRATFYAIAKGDLG